MQRLLSLILYGCLLSLSACSGLAYNPLPTPMPPAYLPTAVALTYAAAHPTQPGTDEPVSAMATLVETDTPTAEKTAMTDLTATVTPTLLAMPGSPAPTPQPSSTARRKTATPSPTPQVPIADIQIFRPGDQSRVVSPLHVAAYLRPGAGGKVRIELLGEDGRVLVRSLKVYYLPSTVRVNLSEDLEFQISAAAEVGRLVISTEDEAGRLQTLNSIDLLLLSKGEADLNPSQALDQAIVLQQPGLKNLIQGGKVVASGLALPQGGGQLKAELIAQDGKVVGQRVFGIDPPAENGYGRFAAEIPYTVSALTPARLIVYQDGGPISPMKHLASVEVVLGP